ncbi:hypothetical protein [uncultured Brevundimonas sp.]|uniref:hypothetical protein n=1 Tax=uncultured Brevundimonas sp. TaxID=213418 RepID=UPI00262E55E2|nr:hypothetical protein [uncultured Brevundimonas sp.]
MKVPLTFAKMAATVALTITVGACIRTNEHRTLPPITASIDEVRVYAEGHCEDQVDRSAGLCKSIVDPQTISKLVVFVNARPDGWATPWAGNPIHKIKVEFLSAGRVDSYLGFDQGSLERGHFLSRSASNAEIAELIKLTQIDPSVLDRPAKQNSRKAN